MFVDLNWIIDVTYAIFDMKGGGPRQMLERLQASGEPIRGQDLCDLVWRDTGTAEIEIYLTFLLGSELLFELNPSRRLSLAKREFVIPALLPARPNNAIEAVRANAWDIHLELEYPWVHRALVERIIVRTATSNPGRGWWRDGALWFDAETQCDVLLEAAPRRGRISLRILARCDGAVPEAVGRVRKLLQEIEPQMAPTTLWFSPDGKVFASEQALAIASATQSAAVACRDNVSTTIDQFVRVYEALGADLPAASGYTAPSSAQVPSSAQIVHYHHYYRKVAQFIGDDNRRYTANSVNSPGAAIAQGEFTTAQTGATIQGSAAPLTQEEHEQRIDETQIALIRERAEVSARLWEALNQFLRIAREIQVGQHGLATQNYMMKDALDDVWLANKVKELRLAPLPASLEVVKAIASNPVMQEVIKKLLSL